MLRRTSIRCVSRGPAKSAPGIRKETLAHAMSTPLTAQARCSRPHTYSVHTPPFSYFCPVCVLVCLVCGMGAVVHTAWDERKPGRLGGAATRRYVTAACNQYGKSKKCKQKTANRPGGQERGCGQNWHGNRNMRRYYYMYAGGQALVATDLHMTTEQ